MRRSRKSGKRDKPHGGSMVIGPLLGSFAKPVQIVSLVTMDFRSRIQISSKMAALAAFNLGG